MSSCHSARRPRRAVEAARGVRPRTTTLDSITIRDLRGYAELDASFGPGPQLIAGPNAAGKTSLLEAIVLLAWGRSHRTSTDGEMVRWGADLTRIEGRAGAETIEVALVRSGSEAGAPNGSPAATGSSGRAGGGARKRIRVNGVPRRATALVGLLRAVLFAPEEMLLVVGSPGLRRAAIDQLAAQRSAAYLRDLATYSRTLQQRNSLLRAIREEQADASRAPLLGRHAARCRSRDRRGPAPPARRPRRTARAERTRRSPPTRRRRLGSPFATRRMPRHSPGSRRGTPSPGDSPRPPKRRSGTARRSSGPTATTSSSSWTGGISPGFASRGQQRTAILAFKLAELDLLTVQDGRPPLLLLDDVFSELDPERRAHLVRRIAELPQAFVTTTTLADLDPALVAAATTWEVAPDDGSGARLVPASAWRSGDRADAGR